MKILYAYSIFMKNYNLFKYMSPLFFAAIVSCNQTTNTSEQYRQPTEKSAPSIPFIEREAHSIINGTLEPELFDVSYEQNLAIGGLMKDSNQYCSGTLIAPNVVLSAAHCAKSLLSSDLSFGIGPDLNEPLVRIPIVNIVIHEGFKTVPSYFAAHDVALYVLADAASDYIPEVIPIRINHQSFTPFHGNYVQYAGYGITDIYNPSEDDELKYWEVDRILSITEYDILTTGLNGSSTCNGDSGGPALYEFDEEIRVVGTVSWGPPECSDDTYSARVDVNFDWIVSQLPQLQDYYSEIIAAKNILDADTDSNTDSNTDQFDGNTDASTDDDSGDNLDVIDNQEDPRPDCDDIGYKGVCINNVAYWCESGILITRDCRLTDLYCGYYPEYDYYYCKNSNTDSI